MLKFTLEDFEQYQHLSLVEANKGRKTGETLTAALLNPVHIELSYLGALREMLAPHQLPLIKSSKDSYVTFRQSDLTVTVETLTQITVYKVKCDGYQLYLDDKNTRLHIKRINAFQEDTLAVRYMKGEISLKEANAQLNSFQCLV